MKLNYIKTWLVFTMLLSITTLRAYYDVPSPYSPAPEPNKNFLIKRFGPVGLSIELTKPNFTMKIKAIEKGSPADKTGAFKVGQVIETINGQHFKKYDPRVIMGNWITQSEANGGKMVIKIKGGKTVNVKLQALGKYSPTWPANCPKSNKIVRQFADFLAKVDQPNYGAALFLLSTGEQKDLDVVKRWFSGKIDAERKGIPWDIGYQGIAICEYYLRTGDSSVIPGIESMAEELKNNIYNGGWNQKGGANIKYGHLNAAGVHCVTFLMLAKECGAKVDETTLQTSLRHFYKYAGHGNLAYGNQQPEGGFVDNGKTIKLAFAMQAAANLMGNAKDSLYAKARDISATKSLYSTSWLFHGHTGGGIGELWRGQGMGVVKEKRPEAYRSFIDGRRWMYELARTYDGAFGWFGGWNVSYETTGHEKGRTWGNFIPLIFTQHLKKLRIYGAGRTPYSKVYDLPKRPWGSENDDVFLSMTPGKTAKGKSIDLSKERFPTHTSKALMTVINDSKISDSALSAYALHIDEGIRSAAARSIVNQKRKHLILPLLKHPDPRARRSGLLCLTGMFKGRPIASSEITPAMFDAVEKMISNPKEAWWVLEPALRAIGLADKKRIERQLPNLLKYFGHSEWWLNSAALIGMTPLIPEQKYYQKLLPLLGKYLTNNQNGVASSPAGNSPISNIIKLLNKAPKPVLQLAQIELGKAYMNYPSKIETPGSLDVTAASNVLLNQIADSINNTNGGINTLLPLAKKRFPKEGIPHRNLLMKVNMNNLSKDSLAIYTPLLRTNVIPTYMKQYEGYLKNQFEGQTVGTAMEGLINLHNKSYPGRHVWKLFGPEYNKINWIYTSFDPGKGKGGDNEFRYSKLNKLPSGLEQWYATNYKPQSGWRRGVAPFGSTNGKKEFPKKCSKEFCKCNQAIATLWEKEVLLLRTKMKLPKMKPNHAYRLLVGGRSVRYGGSGTDVWINGKYIASKGGFGKVAGMPIARFSKYEQKISRNQRGTIPQVDKKGGGRPWGILLTEEIRKEINKGEFTLAVSGLLTAGAEGKKSNHLSFWFEEINFPSKN